MPKPEPPPWLNAAAITTAGRILLSHHRAFGRPLLACADPIDSPLQAAQELFVASTVVLAHDGASDPRLIYANRGALVLWRRPWIAMVGLPSRLTAEPAERRGRAAALERARQAEALQGYGGTRIDSDGRRFHIAGARLWTLWDLRGQACGQAAAFSDWWWLPGRAGSPFHAGEEAEPGGVHRT
jgi:hypothetical protein